jgi:subtilisin family serine protease
MKKLPLIALALLTFAGAASAGTLTPGLSAQMEGMDGSDEIKVLVVLKDQADIASLDWNLRALRAPFGQRHREVVQSLRSVAERSQAPLLQSLEAMRDASTVRGYTPHWLLNAVVVATTVDGVRQLAAREDVDVVEADLVVSLIEPVEMPEKAPLEGRPEARRAIGTTPGVIAVRAPEVWNLLGIDGTGAIVGNMDTGVDGDHPALSARWRGNFAPASECWRDAIGYGDPTPEDHHYHGTHVMGTITGLAPGDTIGVAPGALWIADNTIDQGAGSAFDNDVLAGLEWFADPDGDPFTSDEVPDVVQNSWGVHEGFSGYFDCDSRWWTAIDNCEAAGVVLTWSAGNEGPGSQTIRSPADRADGPYNAFSVGSTQHSPPYSISGFSSRGPSGCGGADATKPEVVAPGSSIYSAEPGGGYQYLDGTSMAGPHVAGVVALMRAANPDLDVTTIKQILMDTAVDLGVAGEDNTYGHGFIDAYEAVLASLTGYGSIEGYVTDSATSNPIEGAVVDVVGDPRSATTDATGFYRLLLPEGSYDLDYSAFGYLADTQTFGVLADQATNGDVALVSAPSARISGVVRDYTDALVPGATISVPGTPITPVLSAADGTYEIFVPDGATYDIRARKNGLGADTHTIVVSGDMTQDFVLPELYQEDFESGDFVVWPWVMGGNADWTIDASSPYEGAYSARSGSITHNQSSTMSLTLELAEAGNVTFWYSVSSESNYDYLRFSIDGAQRAAWSGSIGWTEASFPVSAGSHTFTWSYTKDVSVNGGSDAGWVDLITFPGIGTPPSPGIAVTPGSLSEALAPNQSSTQYVNVSNVGDAPLDFTAVIQMGGGGSAEPVEAIELAKGEPDPRTGSALARGAGGPDGYGYSWIDSDNVGGPTYSWFDISEIGTSISLLDDQLSAPVSIGFAFPFYGTPHTSVKVCSNGFLTFTSTSFTFTNNVIPFAAPPNDLIAAYWDDLNPALGGEIYTYSDPGNGRFVVQWEAVPQIGTGGGAPQTFQIILYDDGTFLTQYESVSDAGSMTAGCENAAGDTGLQVVFNAPYLHDELAILFSFVPPPDPWVVVDPPGGVLAPSANTDLSVTYNSTDLVAGTYFATLKLYSNDPVNDVVDIPITLDVTGATGVEVVGLPTKLALGRAFPNPFGASSSIRYDVPASGAVVDLSVYDVTGRRVQTLVSGARPGGRHTATWNGTDAAGNRVASGTYFYRFKSGDFEATQRIVRLK